MDILAIPHARYGRFDPREEACCLWWSGSGIGLELACGYLTVEAESFAEEHAPWLAVLADGAPIARFPLMKGRHTYSVLAGMDPAVRHEIAILRDTQPTPDERSPILLHGIETDGTPVTPAAKDRLVEFIGDSLTVGEGCTGPRGAEEWRMAWMCNTAAFPSLTAERLRAEKRVIGVSGWGVWKSWDGQETNRLGLVYEKLCPLIAAGDTPYDFQERRADAVIVNLGTNDGNAIQSEADREAAEGQITARAAELIAMVRARQPEALIVWAYGLCGNAVEQPLRRAIDACRKKGDARVFYLPLPDCGSDIGSRQHPSRAAHRRAADCIAAFLEKEWSGIE
ncbi:MAG: hypothetical protein IJ157_09910 [Clostridia bacterium]|nr:hypothetical protein [Clostridia bacterium]